MICGAQFTDRNHGAKTCSSECAKQRGIVSTWNYQTRKRQAFVEPVIPAEIFKRDGSRCHICRRRLSPKTKWPHPRTPSIDHLIPLTRGGLHEKANVRTACLSCNSAKGNRGGNEQLLLIG
jgi:5-methylcytosine-specific restriction endonuclease McrA